MKRWPLHKAWFWETAPFFRILLPFAVGILCYGRQWFSLSGSWPLLVVIFLSLIYLALALVKKKRGFYVAAQFALLSAIVVFCGFSTACYSDARNTKTWFGNEAGKNGSFIVRVTDAPAEKEKTWKLQVSVIGCVDSGRVTTVSGKAFVYLYKDRFPMLLQKGDTVFVPGAWEAIINAGNPFEFDYAGYCRRNNIYYQQFCSANDVRLFATHDPQSTSFTDRVHDWSMAQLATYLPEPKARGLIQAMLLGDEVNLDEELLQSYSETGIVHIIAISGGNVAIFFSAISLALWWVKHKKHLWIKFAIALPLVWFYVIVAGANPSAIRAAVMFSLLAGGIMLQKSNNSLNQLMATAFVLLCAQPMWLFSVGFQLSFVAVLSLVLFYNPVYRWLSPSNKITKALWNAVAASISAEVLVAPLVVYYFHTFPLLFIIANVAAYLFMGVVLYMGMAIIALSWIPVVPKIIGICTIAIVTWFDVVVTWLQRCNPVSFRFIMLSGPELALAWLLIACAAVFLLKKNKPFLFVGTAAACVLLLSLCAGQWKSLHQRRLVAYNTGNANHIELISGKSYAVLYKDTGSQKKADYIVKPSHIGWLAFREDSKDSAENKEAIAVNGKSIVVLNHPADPAGSFHADYLIVNYTGKINARELQKVFNPSLIIIGNNYNRRQQQWYKKDFAKAGVAVHCIGLDGAFVIE